MGSFLNRRTFLKTGSALTAGVALGGGRGLWAAEAGSVTSKTPSAAKIGWLVGVALYTFRRFGCYEALDLIKDLGIRYVEPAFFLALGKARPGVQTNEDLTPEVRKELKQKLQDRGLTMASFYANLDANKDRAHTIFEFCKTMGMTTIVAEPPAAAFNMIEKLCDEYQINVAIHNHPQSSGSKYWHPDNVLAVCKGRGKRIGACCDTGHWIRTGLDPVECLKKLEGRILAFHLKDVAEKGKPEARDVPLGEGQGRYPAILAELKRQGYRGILTIEYEYDSPALTADVAKSVAFVEKMAQKLGS